MRFLRALLSLLVVIATAGIGVLFALQNKVPVPLDLLVYSFSPRSLALWVLSAFAVGGILGMILSSLMLIRLRAGIGGANRQLAKARAEIDRLRTAGLSDSE